MILIGIHGRAGVGKDTAGSFLASIGFNCYAFADPVREVAATLFGKKISDFQTQAQKAIFEQDWNMTRRQMLQFVGTEMVREKLGGNHWIRLMVDRIAANESLHSKVAITDVRFQNEVDFVLEAGGSILHIESSVRAAINPGSKEASHASEQPLDMTGALQYNRYYPIVNDGSMADFKQKVFHVAQSIEGAYPKRN